MIRWNQSHSPRALSLRHLIHVFVGVGLWVWAIGVAPQARSANLELGIGVSSVHEGRNVPAIRATYVDEWSYSVHTSGVRTSVYAQNAWALSAHRRLLQGELGWFNFDLGVGAGAALIDRRYRTSTTSAIETQTEGVLGPSASLRWSAGPVVLGFDALFGLQPSLQHLALNYQDVTHVTLGVRW